MKNIVYKILIAVIVVISNTSCESYLDIHKEYIQDGERIYAPIVDSVTVFGGNQRVVVKLRYYNGNNLDRTVIYWNDFMDSLTVSLKSYNISKGLDSVEIDIPNLLENSYSFNIINYDVYGNKSLAVPAFGNAYGQQYQSAINNRNIKQKFGSGNQFIIRWSAAPDQLIGTEVKYKNLQNTEIIEVRNREDESAYPRSSNNQFVYRSVYLPEENAVDVFYTDWSSPISY